jgi:L-aspartate oxidase
MTHIDPGVVRRRFPGIAEVCAEFGLDVTRDRIPVRPGAHYMMGGVTVDAEGRTTLGGLWAAGEVTASGLHGANRLASNSLLEALVYGAHAGEGASCAAARMRDTYRAPPVENPQIDPHTEPLNLTDIRNSLKSLMWRDVGVRRDAAGLADAIENLNHWRRYVLTRQFADPTGWELQNMLLVAHLMTDAARQREESRGAHVRTDFPHTDDARWKRHLVFRREEEA